MKRMYLFCTVAFMTTITASGCQDETCVWQPDLPECVLANAPPSNEQFDFPAEEIEMEKNPVNVVTSATAYFVRVVQAYGPKVTYEARMNLYWVVRSVDRNGNVGHVIKSWQDGLSTGRHEKWEMVVPEMAARIEYVATQAATHVRNAAATLRLGGTLTSGQAHGMVWKYFLRAIDAAGDTYGRR